MQKNGKGKKIWLALAAVLFGIALVSGGIWIGSYLTKRQAERDRDALIQQVSQPEEPSLTEPGEPEDTGEPIEPEEPEEKTWDEYTLEEKYQAYLEDFGVEVPQKNLDFEELRSSVNEDVYAWIYVPGTNVDDPVVQHPTDDTYYLNYNLDGSMGYPGGIYTEGSCNSRDFTDPMTVIYGHNMKNGTGFGSLHNFEEKSVFDQYRYIFIYLPDDIMVYEIFAAYEGSSNHIIYGHSWDDESWVQYLTDTLYLDGGKDNSLDAYEFTADDHVLTLSTCIRNAPNERYLVQGVLLDETR